MRRRDRVRRQLERIRHRVARLVGAEKNRDVVTAKRKVRYQMLRRTLGERHWKTQRALRRFRASRDLSVTIDESQEVLRRRARNKVEWLRKHPPPLDPDGDGLITIDGKPVSAGVGREVLRIRHGGRWRGIVVSGYRSPEHSEWLCFQMCGQPSCPGRCAGRDSRHTEKGDRDGAVDVSDFTTFAQECRRLGSWLENHLPSDLVHFSDVGN